MRNAFVRTLMALAKERPEVTLITGDLGFTVLEQFRDAFPNQFLNAGVAEQNMMGVAAGMALSGQKVFTYSIIPFTTFRCLEHIRNDICYQRLPVCVVGVGSGYSYGHMGSTHHAIEDIAVMRSLPNMTVLCPGDPWEVEQLVKAASTHDGPCYLRLGKAGEPAIHNAAKARLTIGRAIEVRAGSDVTIIAAGTMLETACKAADLLKTMDVSARLLSMHTVKPIDEAAIVRAAAETGLIATVEEHSSIGGLGGAVAETLCGLERPVRQLIFACPDAFAERCGSQQTLRHLAGLTPENIARRIRELA